MRVSTFPALFLAPALLFTGCLGNHPGSAAIAARNQRQPQQQTVVKSVYHLAFQGFVNGGPRKDGLRSDITSLDRVETVGGATDAARTQDYSFSITEDFQNTREPAPFQTTFLKKGLLGLEGGKQLNPDSVFEATFNTREKPRPGILYKNCTSDRQDPNCSFTLKLPTAVTLGTNALGEATVRKVFDVDPAELQCSFQLSSVSDDFDLKEANSAELKRSIRRTDPIPSPATSAEKSKKASFAFRCRHLPSAAIAVYGYFLQNTAEAPPLTEDGKELQIR